MTSGALRMVGLSGVAGEQARIKSPVPIVDHCTSASTTHTDGTEDDLHSDTLAAGLLANNGDKLYYSAGFQLTAHATATRQLKVKFGGTALLDTTTPAAFASGAMLSPEAWIVRVSASVVRYTLRLSGTNLATGASLGAGLVGEITGLTLANTQIIKATGIAAGTGAASGDIVQTCGLVIYQPAA